MSAGDRGIMPPGRIKLQNDSLIVALRFYNYTFREMCAAVAAVLARWITRSKEEKAEETRKANVLNTHLSLTLRSEFRELWDYSVSRQDEVIVSLPQAAKAKTRFQLNPTATSWRKR
ncbi:hypothetical protein ACJJTC_002376 [Scirpophaga incertulas]